MNFEQFQQAAMCFNKELLYPQVMKAIKKARKLSFPATADGQQLFFAKAYEYYQKANKAK